MMSSYFFLKQQRRGDVERLETLHYWLRISQGYKVRKSWDPNRLGIFKYFFFSVSVFPLANVAYDIYKSEDICAEN